MKKLIENLNEAKTIIQTNDYMLYRVFPLINDQKMLINISLELKKAVTKCINTILQYEYIYKRITLYKNPAKNLEIFENKCAKRYGLSLEEIRLIRDLFNLVKKHESSSMEFVKENKVVILNDNMDKEVLDLEKTKKFLIISKSLLKKASSIIKER